VNSGIIEQIIGMVMEVSVLSQNDEYDACLEEINKLRVYLETLNQTAHIGSTYHQCPECSAPVDKEGQFCAECQPA